MSDDPQQQAEALDEDVVDDADDLNGDLVGESFPDFPPEHPLGVDTVGVTAIEEDAGESFAERTWREEPDVGAGAEPEDAVEEDGVDGVIGQLVDPAAASLDREAQQIADSEPGEAESAEEAAMHVEPDV